MTFARKDFKNIYETGIKELSDIEALAIEKAKEEKTTHSKKQTQTAQQSLDQLETKSGLLQVELKQSINESLKKLQNTLAVENAQSEAFLSSLMIELKTLTGQMKVKLNALKQSHHENVDFARTVATEHYLSNTEQMTFTLEHALSSSLQNLRAKAKGNIEGLDLNLEKMLTDINNKVGDGTKSNLVSLKNQAETIADHSSSLLKTLFLNSQDKLNLLENAARKANGEVESSAGSLLEDIGNHANLIEKDINGIYENISTSHFKNADNRLSHLADELSTLHDTTTEQLVNITDELSDDLFDRSKQVQEGLRNRCDDVVNRVENLFGSFKEKLNDRLQFSRGQKRALESDKNRILIAVQNELLSIQKAFAKKIAGMLDQSKLELIEMTKSVETQMVNATESLNEQMIDSAKSIQQQIEKEVARFLEELSSVRSAALDEITVAAKGNMAISKNIDNYSEKQQSTQPAAVSELNDETIINSQSDKDPLSSADELTVDLENELLSPDENQSNQIIDSEESVLSENKTRRTRRRKDDKE